jgi:hypothetical protein
VAETVNLFKNGDFNSWESNGLPTHWLFEGVTRYPTRPPGYYGTDEFKASKSSYEYGNAAALRLEGATDVEFTTLPTDLNKVMPGIYQVIDLSNYRNNVEIDLSFRTRHDTLNYELDIDHSYYMGIYVYKIGASAGRHDYYIGYDEIVINDEQVYNYANVSDPSKPSSWEELPDEWQETLGDWKDSSFWKEISFKLTLEPGEYYIGFGMGYRRNLSSLNSPVTLYPERLEYLIDSVVATPRELEGEGDDYPYGDLTSGSLLDKSFENSISSSGWTYNSLHLNAYKVLVSEDRPYELRDTYKLGNYCAEISYKEGVFAEEAVAYYTGFKQTVQSKTTSSAALNFWHNSNTLSNFLVRIYKTKKTIQNLDIYYEMIEPPMFEDVIITNNRGWHNYTSIVDGLEAGGYYTIIFYPVDTLKNYEPVCIRLDNITFTTFEGVINDNRIGTYEKPLTERDGQLVSNLRHNGTYYNSFLSFVPLEDDLEYFFIRDSKEVSRKYYCTNMAIIEGRHLLHTNTMAVSPRNLLGMRHFSEDSIMSINKIFEYKGYYYETNSKGDILRRIVVQIDNITVVSATSGTNESGNKIKLLALLTNDTTTITFGFEEQKVDILLKAEVGNTSIATITNMTSGKSVNTITLLAKSAGRTTLRVQYLNVNGFLVENNLEIYVRDILPQGYADAKINMAYKENTMLYRTSRKIDYFIKPDELSDLAVVWSSSNPYVASVDIYGTVRTVDNAGSTTITAKDAYTGDISDSCVITVNYDYVKPNRIEPSQSEITLELDTTTRITARVVSENGSTTNVRQEVVWESKDDRIATVDKYGHITGIRRGTTEITCYSYDGSVSTTITVHVVKTVSNIQSIELDCYEIWFDTNNYNNAVQVRCKVIPSDANNSDIIWSSNKEDVVKVTQGGVVYLNPNYTGGVDGATINGATITCRSKSRLEIYKNIDVRVDYHNSFSNGLTVTYFNTEYKACVGRPVRIDFGAFFANGYSSITYDLSDTIRASVKEDDLGNKYIEFTATNSGTYTVNLTVRVNGANNTSKTVSKTIGFTITVFPEDAAPTLQKDLVVLNAMQNDSAILQCRMTDEIDGAENFKYYIDFNDGNGFEPVYATFYRDSYGSETEIYQYFFLSGYKLTPGKTYKVSIKAVDTAGLECTTSVADLTIPKLESKIENNQEVNNYKERLAEAKADYDNAKQELFSLLFDGFIWSSGDSLYDYAIFTSSISKFYIEYEIYYYTYNNLCDMLEKCVEHISNKIKESQTEVATIATSLTSDGTSVATYSTRENTNSDYKNFTDMDYYQNICIKELTNRVLQLEALIQELKNNNI